MIRIVPVKSSDLKFFKSLLVHRRGLDLQFWRKPDYRRRHVDVWVSGKSAKALKRLLISRRVPYRVVIKDAGYTPALYDMKMNSIETFDNKYQDYEGIMHEVHRLAKVFRKKTTLINIGNSYEQRPLYVFHIHLNKSLTKPKVFINCGAHSREWISVAACMYFIRKMLFDHKYNKEIENMLEEFDIFIMPLMNPDGYKFSHDKDDFRLWRKSRSSTNVYGCQGVDLNRNFNFRWGGTGASRDPCDETYSGEKPFSESETLATARFLYKIRRSLKIFVDVHTFGQMWISPWGYTTNYPQHYEQQSKVLRKIKKALLQREKIDYQTGLAGRVLYETSGDSLDWVYGQLGIVHSYAVELRPHSDVKSVDGFKVTPKFIIPTGRDLTTGIKALTQAVYDEYNTLH